MTSVDPEPAAVEREIKIRRRYYVLLGAAGGSIATFVGCLLVVSVI